MACPFSDSSHLVDDVGDAANRVQGSSYLSVGAVAPTLAKRGAAAVPPAAPHEAAAADGAAHAQVAPSPLDEQGACTLLSPAFEYKPTAQWVPVCLKVRSARLLVVSATAGQVLHAA
jgi:hypothetical protein